jgi:hypothetical protein
MASAVCTTWRSCIRRAPTWPTPCAAAGRRLAAAPAHCEAGVELYWDRPEAEWPRDDAGDVSFAVGDEIDLGDLLATR